MEEEKQYKTPESRTPLAFYHRNIEKYNPEWELYKIVMFEKLILLWKHFKQKPFKFGLESFKIQLRITKTYVTKAKKFFVSKGYLIIETESDEARNKYALSVDAILNDIENIYDFSYLDKFPDDKENQITKFKNFMRLYITTPSKGIRNLESIAKEFGVSIQKAEDITKGRFQITDENYEYSTDV